MTKRPEFLPFLLAFAALLAIAVLAALGEAIPTVLSSVLYAASFGGAAVLHPASRSQDATTSTDTPAAPDLP